MNLQKAVSQVFLQLTDSLSQLETPQFYQACKNLSGHSIGQHVRHIIEMFQCLEDGYQSGELDYEKRKRDVKIETDRDFALSLLPVILNQLSKPDKTLELLVYYDDLASKPERIHTNYLREIAYNLEHTVHHMALIRIGFYELGDWTIEENFGVASSTIKFRQQCVR